MHFIDGEPVGSINYAELEARQQQEKKLAEKPVEKPKAPPKGGATVTSQDVKT